MNIGSVNLGDIGLLGMLECVYFEYCNMRVCWIWGSGNLEIWELWNVGILNLMMFVI